MGKRTGKGIRFSIQNKILVCSLSVNLLICLVMGIVVYNVVYSRFIAAVAEDARALAMVSSNRVDGDLFNTLNEGDDEKEENLIIQRELEDIKTSGNMNSVYTIARRDGKLVYMTLPAEFESPLADPVEEDYIEETELAFNSANGCVETTVVKDEDTYYITAYAPVKDGSGSTVGVIGIDYIINDIVATLNNIIVIIICIGTVLLAVSVVISVFISRGITRGLRRVNGKVYDLVANDGDLTSQIDINSNDEVGDIADNINGLLKYIRNVVRKINECSGNLSGSVDTVLNTTIRTNDEINDVSATMEKMSTTMEETSASLQQIQGTTNHIKNDVDVMFGSVKEGTSYAFGMQKRAEELYSQAEIDTNEAKAAADKMTVSLNDKIEKSKAVENISGLTDQILEIASQTNLLSLNASIEAARAGEHGKGFAVVASEISNLASNSADTAREIQSISEEVIANVRDLAEEATRMVEFVREKTVGGYQKLMDTGMQYQSDAEKITGMLENVETASKNIEGAMNDVSKAMDDVSGAVEDSARGITEMAMNVADMSDNMNRNKDVANENARIAEQLDGEVNRFRF